MLVDCIVAPCAEDLGTDPQRRLLVPRRRHFVSYSTLEDMCGHGETCEDSIGMREDMAGPAVAQGTPAAEPLLDTASTAVGVFEAIPWTNNRDHGDESPTLGLHACEHCFLAVFREVVLPLVPYVAAAEQPVGDAEDQEADVIYDALKIRRHMRSMRP